MRLLSLQFVKHAAVYTVTFEGKHIYLIEARYLRFCAATTVYYLNCKPRESRKF